MDTTFHFTKIVMHGRLADMLGRELEIAAPARAPVAELRRRIAAAHPDAAGAILSDRVRACVGDTIVSDRRCPEPGEVVEFLPPVSGG